MLLTGLSARLLLLTVFFVMLSEVFIYAPSIGRYRIAYMEERIAAAQLASLALEAPANNRVSTELLEELLKSAKSYGIVLRRPESRALMLSRNMPPEVHATYDTRDTEFFALIGKALSVMWSTERRMIRIVGPSPRDPNGVVETVINEWIMREMMLDYSGRILLLSIVISLMTATLVFFSLQWMFVRPMMGLTDSMEKFRRDPDDARMLIRPGRRRDEIGRAQRELAQMQRGLRDALKQRTHLAGLGTALSFANEGSPAPELTHFDLAGLVSDIATEISARDNQSGMIENSVSRDLSIFADRDQLYRVLSNLVLNAFQAGATKVAVTAQADAEMTSIEVADNGPGLPARVREHLFEPFQSSTRVGGTGLGLAIARDLMRGHGGDAELVQSSEDGTTFVLRLPVEEKRERVRFGRAPGTAEPGPPANAAE